MAKKSNKRKNAGPIKERKKEIVVKSNLESESDDNSVDNADEVYVQ